LVGRRRPRGPRGPPAILYPIQRGR
jgi:hypothetical protein